MAVKVQPAPAVSGGALTRTAVKTAAYTASPGELVACDPTGGAFTVTLPNAPADKAQVEVKVVTTTAPNAVTVACAGSDVFNVAGGATTALLSVPGHGALFQYDAAAHIWTVLASDTPLAQVVQSINGQKGAVTVPVLTTVTTKTADYTASAGEAVPVDASGGTRTVTLPAGTRGQQIRVQRVDTGFTTANVVRVTGGPSSDEVLQPGDYIDFVHDGTAWRRYPSVSGAMLLPPLGMQNADPLTDQASLFQRPYSRVVHHHEQEIATFTSPTDFDEPFGGSALITADPDPYHPAGSPLLATSTANVDSTMTKFLRAPVDLSSPKKIIRFLIKLDASTVLASLSSCELRFASDRRAFAKGNYHRLLLNTFNETVLPLGVWRVAGGSPVDLTAVGAGSDLTNVVALQLALRSTTANGAKAAMGPWVRVSPSTADKPKGVFWLDDNYTAHWTTALAMFERYGWKAQLALNIAQPDGNPPETLRRLNKYGWPAGSHAYANAEHVALTGTQLRESISKSRAAAAALGLWGGEDFAWWGGLATTADTIKVVEQFFRTGRFNQSANRLVETIPPVMPSRTGAWLQADGEALSGPQAYIDRVIAAGGLGQFVIHNMTGPAVTWLQGILDYLDARRDLIDVVILPAALVSCLSDSPIPPSPYSAPGAPGSIAAQDVNGGESIAWTPPASNGGAQIIAYAIQRRTYTGATPGAWSTVLTVRTSDMLQSALMATDTTAVIGTTYDYRVVARNRVGDGPPSAVINVTPAAVARPGSAPASAIAPAGWWVPDDSAAAGGAAIASIPDRSAGAHAMAPAFTNGPTKLAGGLAGRSVAHSLAASQNGMKGAVPVKAEDITVLLVARPLALSGSGTGANYLMTGVATNFASTNDLGVQYAADGSAQIGPARTANMVPTIKRLALNAWGVIAASLDSAANSHQAKADLNGEARTDTPSAYTAATATANVGVGGALQATGIDMDWAEAIVFTGALSDADRKAWETYLGKTWGLPVYPF
jgi:hypothetical protein